MTDAPELLPSFQDRIKPWLIACLGELRVNDREERNQRFLEESLELVQATGCHRDVAHQLVDHVYARPIGDPSKEVGNLMTALAALCIANGIDMGANAESDLTYISQNADAIRARHDAKPLFAPLPMTDDAANTPDDLREMVAREVGDILERCPVCVGRVSTGMLDAIADYIAAREAAAFDAGRVAAEAEVVAHAELQAEAWKTNGCYHEANGVFGFSTMVKRLDHRSKP